jgi:hypothetical protein
LLKKFQEKSKIKNFTRFHQNEKNPSSLLKSLSQTTLYSDLITFPIRARIAPRFCKIPKQSPK